MTELDQFPPPPRRPRESTPNTEPADSAQNDRAARLARLQAKRVNGERTADPSAAAGATPTGPTPRRHPARGARAAALVASVAATGGVAGAMAYAAGGSESVSTVDMSPAVPTPNVVAGAATPEVGGSTPADSIVDPDVDAAVVQATATTPLYADGIWPGTAEYTEWGDVQVEVVVIGGQIFDIRTVQIPDDRKSTRINNRATPVLEAAAIAIQAADLDIVSGATYTSRTYEVSLQAALDQAALAIQSAQVQS